MKRPWPFLFMTSVCFLMLAGLVGCRRKSLDDLQLDLLLHEKKHTLRRLGTGYDFDFKAWPAGLPHGPILLLAQEGLLDDYVKFDPHNEDHLECLPEGRYELLPNGEYLLMANKATGSNKTNFYVHLVPSAIREFQEHYKTKVLISRIRADESLYGKKGGGRHDPKQYDLIMADRSQILPLVSKVGLQKFNPKNLPRFEEIRSSLHAKFPRVSEDPDFLYCVPYHWGTYGFFYNLGHVPNPPDDLSALFHFEESAELVSRVSFVDSREVMFGLAMLYLKDMSLDELNHEKADTQKLLDMYDEIKKVPTSLLVQKQRLLNLLRAFWELHHDKAKGESDLKKNGTSFTLPPKSKGTNLMTLEEYYARQTTNGLTQVSMVDIPQEETIQEIVKVMKRCILFGASFRPDADLTRLISGDDYFSIGLGGGALIALQGNRNIRFQIPRSDNIVVLKIFVMPQEVTGDRKTRAEFFLNFLLQPKAAADMVSFDLLASTSSDAREFVNPELLNSPLYSLQDPSTTHYLPIIDDSDFEDHWMEVKAFHAEVSQILQSR